MHRSAVCFKTKEKVCDILHVLETCAHNGFPVVDPTVEICAYERERLRRSKSSDSAEPKQKQSDASATSQVEHKQSDAPAETSPSSTLQTSVTCEYDHGVGWQGDSKRRDEEGKRGWLTLCGLILRKQLVVLLTARVWRRAPSSVLSAPEWRQWMNQRMLSAKQLRASLTEEDLQATVDLEPYMNRSPLEVRAACLATHVYCMFRSMGLRHMPVVDVRHQVVGIITRYDLLPHRMDAATSARHGLNEVELGEAMDGKVPEPQGKKDKDDKSRQAVEMKPSSSRLFSSRHARDDFES